MAHVLVVDDDDAICSVLCRCVERLGHSADYATTLAEGEKKASAGLADVVLLDVRFPDGNGLEALPRLRQAYPDVEVLIITGEADSNDAELAIKSGAWDYLKKPLSLSEVALQLKQVLQYRQERVERKTAVALKRDNLIGDSPQMRSCLDLLVQAASSDVNVLVTGETGTGKELFCRAIHENSARSVKPFVVVDCAALPETLLESVLFGHVKGAFTGADKSQPGLVRQANGGTLFLDEIGELPLSMQRAFLRVLQERQFRPVGGSQEETSDFRLLAATNRDLGAMVEAGSFRSDLLFRIQAHRIALPTLRERKSDIPALVKHHVFKFCSRRSIPPKRVSDGVLEALQAYDWPGNVRELVGVLESALAAMSGENTLFIKHLPVDLRLARTRQTVPSSSAPQQAEAAPPVSAATLQSFHDYLQHAVDQAERRYLERLIAAVDGDVKSGCQVSQLSRSRIYQLLRKHSLSLSR